MMDWMTHMIHKKQRQLRRRYCNQGNLAWGILIGAAAGAAAGLLLAPKSGKELRADLVDKAGQALEGATEKTAEVGEKVKTTAKKVQTNIQDTVDHVKKATKADGKTSA